MGVEFFAGISVGIMIGASIAMTVGIIMSRKGDKK